MGSDPRAEIYHDLHKQQMSRQEEQSHHSAMRILSLLKEYIEPRSLLDIGCGLGTWLRGPWDSGINDVMGIEGPWLNRELLVVEPSLVQVFDLEQPFSVGRRFDLVVCLEVAEHLNAPWCRS